MSKDRGWSLTVSVVVVLACSGVAACGGRSPGAGSRQRRLDCNLAAAHSARPDDRLLDLGPIAMESSESSPHALQTTLTGSANPSLRLAAKTGLFVRAGSSAEIAIAPTSLGHAAISWGTNGKVVDRLLVGPCATDGADWLVFPGGYYVSEVACVDLAITSNGLRRDVHVGVGAPCAGQVEPTPPSDR